MAFSQNFVSQQLSFLFSKHLDKMSNVTDCGYSQKGLCFVLFFNMVRPSVHYGREKHKVTRDISCHIHPELSTWIITSKSKKPLSKETQNQMES